MPRVQLRDISTSGDRAVVTLLRHGPGQAQYLDSMEDIFAQADEEQRANPHPWAVHDVETGALVGFAMISDNIPQPMDETDSGMEPASVRVVTSAEHGTSARWYAGCHCALCRRAVAYAERSRGRARAQKRLPLEVRQQLLDAIYNGQPFRTVLRDLNLTPNQVWGLTKTDEVNPARGRPDGDPPGRSGARHECRVCGGLCLQRVPRAPGGSGWRGTATNSPIRCSAGVLPGHGRGGPWTGLEPWGASAWLRRW
jgi:hypothetical protein